MENLEEKKDSTNSDAIVAGVICIILGFLVRWFFGWGIIGIIFIVFGLFGILSGIIGSILKIFKNKK
jgi:hypothetical protein